jgi:hypothetical protein
MRESFQRLWVPEERRREIAAAPVVAPLSTRLLLALLAGVILFGGIAQGLVRWF